MSPGIRTTGKALALLLALSLLAVACGDDSDGDADPGSGAADDEVDGASDPAVDADTTDDGADSSIDDGTSGEADVSAGRIERIVSLSPSATEILFAIGAGDLVVAVDSSSSFPADAPVTDLDGVIPDVDAIAEFEPDLVAMRANAASADLEALGATVIARDAPVNIDGVYTQIEELGAATGRIAEAAELVLEMQTELDDLLADAPDATGVTYYHELGTDLFSLNGDSFIGSIYTLFGLTSIGDAAEGLAVDGYLPLTEEYVLGADPDLIFLADTVAASQTAETLAERPGWENLTAVQGGFVIELDDDVASRWGPRVTDLAESIADALQTLAVPG